MIKLASLLKEFNQDMQDHEHTHVNDHLKHIIKHAAKALKSNDYKVINESITEIINHAQAVADKNYLTKDKSGMHSADDNPLMQAHGSDIADNI
jgi:hypothetical protein